MNNPKKKKVKKKVKKKANKKYNKLQKKILKYSKYISIPNNYTETNIQLHTNIDVIKSTSPVKIIKKDFKLEHDILKNDPIKTVRYRLFPTETQEKVLQKWFIAYIEMYNFVIDLIKTDFKKELAINSKIKLIDLEIDINIGKLKKKAVNEKNYLRNKYSVNMHILDYALTDAIAMFKSKISNLKNGHIRKSKLKYLKKTKNNRIIKIEQYLCSNSSFCVSELGSEMKTKPNINFKETIKRVGIVQYNQKKNKYYLLVRTDIIHDSTKNEDIIETNQLKLYEGIISTSKKYLKFIKNKLDNNINIDAVKNLNKKMDVNKRRLVKNRIYQNKKKFKNDKSNDKKPLSIDPGIRTFLTFL
jgi:hypothetical protein